jgi:hypothetical protein
MKKESAPHGVSLVSRDQVWSAGIAIAHRFKPSAHLNSSGKHAAR